MSKIFREAIEIAYRGILPDEVVEKMVLADLDRDLAEAEMEIFLLRKKEEDKSEQIRNENFPKDLI